MRTVIRCSSGLRQGYSSWPRYFFASLSIWSSAPSVVSSAVPLTATHLYVFSGSTTSSEIRGSRRRWRSFARPTAVLKPTSPLASTQTIVECGEPSWRRVVTVTTKGCCRKLRALSSRVVIGLLSVAIRLVARWESPSSSLPARACSSSAVRKPTASAAEPDCDGRLAGLAAPERRRCDRVGAACRSRAPCRGVLDGGRRAPRAFVLARASARDRLARAPAHAWRLGRATTAWRAGAAALRPADARGQQDASLLQLLDRGRPARPAPRR